MSPSSKIAFDSSRVRRDFPILETLLGDKPLVYLDNAATTQKPRAVIETIQKFYLEQNSNIHRGVHYLSAQATDAYELARQKIADFLGAASASEIVFVRGATEAINLVAQSFGGKNFRQGDEVIISEMEHHANIVPWQLLAERVGLKLRVLPVSDAGELDLTTFQKMLNERTCFVSIVHVSNTLGTLNPVKEIIKMAHAAGVPVLLDGAQSAPHMRIDVQDLDCDFFVCSSHKMFGPTGVGVLWGRAERLAEMPPWEGGGDMIRTVTFEKTTFKDAPGRFEAGTPHIAGVIALGAAVDYLESLDHDAAEAHEADLLAYAEQRLMEIDGLCIHGRPAQRMGVISFSIENIHPHDIGTILDTEGIAIRAGHHCTQPLMRRLGVPATARPSFSIYNTREEVDMLVNALQKIRKMFA
ncbi:MAG: SufS family cysteine desulfurase [Chthoniobacterales bacterium]